jgi:hypothetical protein
MTYHLKVAIGWDERMGPPETGPAKEMHSWHADEAVRLRGAESSIRRGACPAARSHCAEDSRRHRRMPRTGPSRGSGLAARLGETALAESFAGLLESGG